MSRVSQVFPQARVVHPIEQESFRRLRARLDTSHFAPLTRGLQAALPFVDDFLPVRTLRDVRDLSLHLNALT